MRFTSIVTAFCVALAPAAFGQSAPANTIATAGYTYPAPVSVAPGQVITLFVAGLGPGDITATLRQGSDHPAPVLSTRPSPDCVTAPGTPCVAITAVTIQIPYELQSPCSGNVCNALLVPTELFLTQNGIAGPSFSITPLTDRIHILTTCDTVVSGGTGYPPSNGLPCTPFITHGDGSLVTSQRAAHRNEELVAYAVGLGATSPAVPTGQPAVNATPTVATFEMDYNFQPNALPSQPVPAPPGVTVTRYVAPLFTGLVPGYVGLYQVNFVLPPPPVSLYVCGGAVQSNVTVSIGSQFSFDGAGICESTSE